MKAPVFAVRAAARREFVDSTDSELLRRFADSKDDDAFAELVRRYGPLVWRVARTTAAPVAEDVFQATFLTLSKNSTTVHDPAALAGWLHRTAHRAAVRARKAEAKRSHAPPIRRGPSADPLDTLTARELLAAVDEELAALPDALRAAVVLCGIEGLSQDEAAKRLGWKPGSVKGRLERGRAKLLTRLAARGLALPAVLGGLTAVPAELMAATLESVRGAAVAPSIAALVAEGTPMAWSTILKPTAVLAAVAALAIAATGGADPGPAAAPQVVKPTARADPAPPALIRWSVPLRTDLDDPSLPGGTAGVWTPDGQAVLVAGSARPEKDMPRVGEVRVHDATSGKVVHTHRGSAMSYENRAGHLAIRKDGKFLAAGGYTEVDGQREFFVEVWDWGQERPRFKLGAEKPLTDEQLRQVPPGLKPPWPDHLPSYVSGVAFAPYPQMLYGTCLTGQVKAWDLTNNGKRFFESRVSQSRSWALAVHPRGKTIAVTTEPGGLSFLGTVGELQGKLDAAANSILSVTFSPDGKSVAFGGLTDADRVPIGVAEFSFDAETSVAKTGAVHHGPANFTDLGAIYQVAYSPDGKLLAAACQDKSVRVFDAATLKPLAIAVEHTDFVYSVQFSPDGKSLLTVGRDAVKVWSVAELMKRMPKPVDPKAEKAATEKRHREKFHGEWTVFTLVVDGKEIREGRQERKAHFTFTDDRWLQRADSGMTAGTVSAVDPTASPKMIDLAYSEGPDKGKVVKAVYEFVDWETCRLCSSQAGTDRPTALGSKPGSGHVLMVLKRVMPKK